MQKFCQQIYLGYFCGSWLVILNRLKRLWFKNKLGKNQPTNNYLTPSEIPVMIKEYSRSINPITLGPYPAVSPFLNLFMYWIYNLIHAQYSPFNFILYVACNFPFYYMKHIQGICIHFYKFCGFLAWTSYFIFIAAIGPSPVLAPLPPLNYFIMPHEYQITNSFSQPFSFFSFPARFFPRSSSSSNHSYA